MNQVTLLTQDIEDSFSAKKAGSVFVNLTAAYNTVWHRGLTCKPLQLLHDIHMVRYLIGTNIQRQLRYQYCAANKLQASFCRCSNTVKNVLFCSSVRSCRHHNNGVTSGGYICKDCV